MGRAVDLLTHAVIHHDFDSEAVLAAWRRPRDYSRSCDILGHFIESVGGRQGGFRGVPLYRAHSLDQGIKRLSLSTMSAPSAGHIWPPSAWANQAPGSLRMRARASVAPRYLTLLHDTAHRKALLTHEVSPEHCTAQQWTFRTPSVPSRT